MKHVLRKIQKGASIVAAGAILLTANACDRKEVNKTLEKYKETKKELQKIKNIITSDELMAYISSSDNINELKEKFYTVKNSENLDSIEKEIIQSYFDKLVNKYFNEEDRNKFSIEGAIREDLDADTKLMIKINGIENSDNLVKFLDELREYYDLYTLQIDDETLLRLDYKFDALTQLIINSKDEYPAKVDLSNFENLKYLDLIDANVKNIPNTVEAISFGSMYHNEDYRIDSEIRELPNLPKLFDISFYNMNVPIVSLPIMNNVSLEFSNCVGETTIYNTNTNILSIENTSNDKYCNFVTIKGKINDRVEIICDKENVVLDKIEGECDVVYSPVPEVARIGEPTTTR